MIHEIDQMRLRSLQDRDESEYRNEQSLDCLWDGIYLPNGIQMDDREEQK